MSFTSNRPLGRARMPATALRLSLATAVTGPSWRTGGSDDCEYVRVDATTPITKTIANQLNFFIAENSRRESVANDDYLTASTAATVRPEDAAAGDTKHRRP